MLPKVTRPPLTQKGDAMVGDLRTDALHEAFAQAEIPDQTLIGLLVLSGLIYRETKYYLDNDPQLRAGKAQIDAFMAGHPGGIDTYESTGR